MHIMGLHLRLLHTFEQFYFFLMNLVACLTRLKRSYFTLQLIWSLFGELVPLTENFCFGYMHGFVA